MQPGAAVRSVVETLEKHYGKPAKPPVKSPFEQVLWDVACYLVPDETRARVLARLRRELGTKPDDLLSAKRDALVAALADGGMKPAARAQRVREAATIAKEIGNLTSAAKKPLPEATRTFALFPGIGVPGAEKILLFAGSHAVPALESNGLRVLERLGYARPGGSYARTYRNVREAIEAQPREDATFWTKAHLLLRRHGQETCRRLAPRCDDCPLRPVCEWPARR